MVATQTSGSRIHTREQRLAQKIYPQVERMRTRPDEPRDTYKNLAQTLPVLIRTAGLAQALAFLAEQAKQKPADQGKPTKETGAAEFFRDLAATLGYNSGEELARASREAPLPEYMRLTREALAALLWYKRFCQAVFDGGATS